MPSETQHEESTAIHTVFERLLVDIVQGTYPQGERLPAERELARALGASRPTLREALRKLGAWSLVAPRRGSGVVVKPYREWSIEVVAAYIRYGAPRAGQPPIARVLIDVLTLRRTLLIDVLRESARRVPPGGTEAARAAMARAWANRDDPAAFARDDFDAIRLILESAQFTPGVWVLNRIFSIWQEFVDALAPVMRLPEDYVAVYTRFFDLLDAGEPEPACATLEQFLRDHDEALAAAAGAIAT
ncbi:MAG: GntR family transcriptional regulator [Kofleriaceae bacterium]